MKNKKFLIGGGIAAFIIGTVVGVYIYTKKSIGKIAAAIDDTFDIEDNNNTIQYQFDLTKTNKNGSSCAKDAFISEEEEKRTIKMPKISYCCYDTVGIDRAMQNDIDELKTKVEELEKKIDNLNVANYNILFDDKHYNDYIKTMNAFFGDDGK